MKRVRFGTIHADVVTQREALDRVHALVRALAGGYVVTPNVDHVVLAETDERLRAAYADAALALCDGMPLVWLARLLGHPLPEKISGSDFVRPLMQHAAREHLRTYLLGGAPGVATRARDLLTREYPGLEVVGCDAPPVGFEADPGPTLERLRATRPHLVLVALGCPKQELFMHTHYAAVAPAVMLGIGASLDFIAGVRRRAPRWLSRFGLEWAFRLGQEPRRLAQRYLLRDRQILAIAARMLREPAAARAFHVTEGTPSRVAEQGG